jgi:hypothetical protein
MNPRARPGLILLVMVGTVVAAPSVAVDPSTLKDKVSIRVGTRLIVRFDQKDDALSNPRMVEEPGEEPPTPIFDFRVVGGNYLLATKNPFKKDLKFRALARLKGRQEYFETTIVPVKSGLFGIEHWQDPIEELVLFEFALVEED